jgi:hypothetical protein
MWHDFLRLSYQLKLYFYRLLTISAIYKHFGSKKHHIRQARKLYKKVLH